MLFYSYLPNGNKSNLLALDIGDRVVVLEKFSENQGWWKACDATHWIGYIPKSYVRVLPNGRCLEVYFISN